MSLFVTGGTGFLGSEVLSQLSGSRGKIYLLVRPHSMAKAQQKYERYEHIVCVAGDLKNSQIVEDSDNLELLQKEITQVLHMAAVYDFNASASDNYLNNVVGTQNLLHFCDSLEKLKYFYLTSTVAIAGDFKGLMYESMFNVGQNLPDPYAETKFRVEGLVGSWKSRIKKVVFRLGVIVGNTRDGHTCKIDGPYYLLGSLLEHPQLWHSLSRLGLTPLPYNPESVFHIVPVDSVANIMVEIIEKPVAFKGPWRTYHLTGPGISLKEFFTICFRQLGYETKLRPLPKWIFPKRLYSLLNIPLALEHYMYAECIFVSQTLAKDYPHLKIPHFKEYQSAFFEFIKSKDFPLKGRDK